MAMGMRQAWRTLREVDLGAIKAEAEQRFGLVLIGEPRSTAHLAETLSARPGQRGAHPWIVQLPAGDASGLQAALARHEGQPRLALLVTRSVEPGAEAQADLSRLRAAGVPALTVLLVDGAAEILGAALPRSGETGRALLPAEPDAEALRDLAPALLAATENARGLRLALARQLPALRGPIVEDLVEEVARTNAGYAFSTGLGEALPGVGLALGLADVLVLTKNQLVMAYRIALAAGREGSPRELLGEVAGVIGGGLLFRQIARELVGLLPVIGILPKVAVAYAGTRLIGRTVQLWADEGQRLELDELRGLYAEALAGGQRLARELLHRRGPSEPSAARRADGPDPAASQTP